MTRTDRYLPIRTKIAECEKALEATYGLINKVDQLVALEKLLEFKRNIKNI
jgi:hypothetical protein